MEIAQIYKQYMECKLAHPIDHRVQCRRSRKAWIDAVHGDKGKELMELLTCVV